MCIVAAAPAVAGAAAASSAAATASAMAVAGMALSAAAAAATYAGQQQAAKAQSNYQNKVYSQTTAAALEAQRFNTSQLQLREYQETAAASREAEQAARGVAAGRGSGRAGLGSMGLGGNTAAALIQEFDFLEADAGDTIQRNYGFRVDQLRKSGVSLSAETQGRISSASPRPVNGPSPVAAAIELGGALLSGYSDIQYRYNPPAYTYRGMGLN